MSVAVVSFGTAVPTTALSQAESEGVARALSGSPERAAWLTALYAGSGIASRHLAFEPALVADVLSGSAHSGSVFLPKGDPTDHGPTTAQRMEHYARLAAPLALRAAREALDRAALAPGEVTHLVTASCTGFYAPGVDVALMKGLGLPATTERTQVGFMGCHAALNALRVARAFADAAPRARVLVCAVELCSLHYHYGWDLQRVVANSLFADGAAAAVCVPEASAAPGAWRLVASGSCLLPDSEGAMTWTVGDHGFVMTLSKQIPSLIATSLRPWLSGWLRLQGLELTDVRTWAVHPGGLRILTAVEEALGLEATDTAVSREILAANGNMSSPTVLFILDRLMSLGAERPCVALGFGPGLNAEVALFR